MIKVNRSIGIGAKFVSKYVAVPNPITTKPIPKQTTLLYHSSGVIKLCNRNNHISIPIPVINAVNNPKTSGLCLFKNELQPINMKAIMISQLPTVSPTFWDSPVVFRDDGEYDIESQIIPFLSTLKGFKFGFNSGMRVEVLFVNTKEFVVKWGTQNAINIPAPGLPGGMPIRANGTFNFKVADYIALIDQIAGVREQYLVEDVKIRISAVLDQLLMKWITREGKDMFNLQANSFDISKGIQEDLDMQMIKSGISVTGFNVMSFSYPKEIQDRITKNASHGWSAI